MKRYVVWRHHQKMGVFTFKELKPWMLERIPDYADRIKSARFIHQLQNIACNTEYCYIRIAEDGE